ANATGFQTTALGAGALANFTGSTAIGTGATTTRASQIVLGRSGDTVTIPNLSGTGSGLILANDDGTLSRSAA
ncbi:hypothetical protein, partial [Aphanothece microscopica]